MNFIKSLMGVAVVFLAYGAHAQCPGCVIQTASCPASNQEVQLCSANAFTATAGDTFAETVTFALPVSMVIRQGDPIPFIPIPFPGGSPFDINIFIDSIKLNSVTGLPTGLSWESDSAANGNLYFSYVYQYGCLNLCGDIACGTTGTFNVAANFSWTTTYSTSDPNFQMILNQFMGSGQASNGSVNLTLTVDPSTNLVLDLTTPNTTTVIDSGETITLNATTGFDTYLWSSGQTTETITVSPADTTTYVVTVTDNYGCEQVGSMEVQVLAVEDSIPTDTTDTTGITIIGYNDVRLQVYPNPNQGSFTVEVAQQTDVKAIEILDITGKRVWHQTTLAPNNVITLENAKGLYIVKVTTANGLLTRKLLIH